MTKLSKFRVQKNVSKLNQLKKKRDSRIQKDNIVLILQLFGIFSIVRLLALSVGLGIIYIPLLDPILYAIVGFVKSIPIEGWYDHVSSLIVRLSRNF